MEVLPLIPRLYREIGGDVYGNYISFNIYNGNILNYKHILIDDYIHNVD